MNSSILLLLALVAMVTRATDTSNMCPEPEGCHCFNSGDGVRAECTGENIEFVPDTFPLNVTEIKITNSGMQLVLAHNFSMYPATTSLELQENDIHTIEAGAFLGLDNCDSINLHTNNLTELPDNLFDGTPLLDTLSLYNNRLTEVPDVAGLSQLRYLYLQINKITGINAGDLVGLSNLMVLDLFLNEIVDIEEGVFRDLAQLTVLQLNENKIMGLQEGDFEGLTSLQQLKLDDNAITSLPENVFVDSPMLQTLDLSLNEISAINDNAFRGLEKLPYLDLDYNRLEAVPRQALAPLIDLDYLDLSGNLFESLESDAFSGHELLREVFLNDMPTLVEIQLDVFKGLRNASTISLSFNPNLTTFTPEHLPDEQVPLLELLYLSNNGFTYLSRDIFYTKERLLRADIHGNPYYCNCSLQWIPQVLEEDVTWASGWHEPGTAPRCSYPPHLEGAAISEMVEADLTCDPVEIELLTPTRIEAYLRGNSTFKAKLYNGYPASMWKTPHGEWLIPNTVPPPEDPRYDVQAMADEEHTILAYLNIDNTSTSDAGEYLLVATNIEGNVTHSFELLVLPYEQTYPTTTPSTGGARACDVTYSVLIIMLGLASVLELP